MNSEGEGRVKDIPHFIILVTSALGLVPAHGPRLVPKLISNSVKRKRDEIW